MSMGLIPGLERTYRIGACLADGCILELSLTRSRAIRPSPGHVLFLEGLEIPTIGLVRVFVILPNFIGPVAAVARENHRWDSRRLGEDRS